MAIIVTLEGGGNNFHNPAGGHKELSLTLLELLSSVRAPLRFVRAFRFIVL